MLKNHENYISYDLIGKPLDHSCDPLSRKKYVHTLFKKPISMDLWIALEVYPWTPDEILKSISQNKRDLREIIKCNVCPYLDPTYCHQ